MQDLGRCGGEDSVVAEVVQDDVVGDDQVAAGLLRGVHVGGVVDEIVDAGVLEVGPRVVSDRTTFVVQVQRVVEPPVPDHVGTALVGAPTVVGGPPVGVVAEAVQDVEAFVLTALEDVDVAFIRGDLELDEVADTVFVTRLVGDARGFTLDVAAGVVDGPVLGAVVVLDLAVLAPVDGVAVALGVALVALVRGRATVGTAAVLGAAVAGTTVFGAAVGAGEARVGGGDVGEEAIGAAGEQEGEGDDQSAHGDLLVSAGVIRPDIRATVPFDGTMAGWPSPVLLLSGVGTNYQRSDVRNKNTCIYPISDIRSLISTYWKERVHC